MKLFANGGTDGANIVLFWPDHLPDNADDILREDPVELVERLEAEGKLVWFFCDGDGSYSLLVFVNAEIPHKLLTFCEQQESHPVLRSKGIGYFGGMEYMFKQDSSFRERYPHMLDEVPIPEGEYAAKVYRTNVDESFRRNWLIEQAGREGWCLWLALNWAVALGVLGGIASMLGALFLPLEAWVTLLAVSLSLLVASSWISKTESYQEYVHTMGEFHKEYPTYVVALEELSKESPLE